MKKLKLILSILLAWIASSFKAVAAKWKAETPILAKWIRNTSGAVLSASLFMLTQLGTSSVIVPAWFSQHIWYVIAISALGVGFFGTREKKV